MWVYILLLVCVINIIFTNKDDRKVSNPSICFSLLWTFIVWLSSLRWLSLHKTADREYFLICIGTIFFVVGSQLSKLFRDKNFVTQTNYENEYNFRYRLLCILAIGCILFYFPDFVKSIIAMLSGVSLNDVRSSVQESEYSTGLANLIPNYIILPVAIALEPLAIIDFWFGKRNKPFIGLVLVLVMVRALGDGGRTPVFNMVLYFIVANIILNQIKKKEEPKNLEIKEEIKAAKDKKMFKKISVAGVALLGVLTFMRAANTIFRKLYFYFAMSPVLFSRWNEYMEPAHYRGYGLVSFNGIFYFFDYIRKNFFGSDYVESIIEAYNAVALTDSQWMKIAPTTTANAYVSCFWFFYTDGGVIGVILLSLLYGFVMGRCYDRMKKKKDICTLALFLLLYQGVFFSFIRFPFAKAYYVIAIVIVLYVAFEKTMRRRNNDRAFD